MIQTEYLIIGQGIAGTLLSYELMQAGKSFIVVDEPNSATASRLASAVINPLVAKRWTPAADIEVFLPQAISCYQKMGLLLGADLLAAKELLLIHQSVAAKQIFETQLLCQNPYVNVISDEDIAAIWGRFWNAEQGMGGVSPVYTVANLNLLQLWQAYLIHRGLFLPRKIETAAMEFKGRSIVYDNIEAEKVVFCEGVGALCNPFFPRLSFTKNRGDILLLRIPDLPEAYLYQIGSIRLVPKGDGLFWCGSNYVWDYDSLAPDLKWSTATEEQLSSCLKLPYKLIAHEVAERPTTAGQSPLLLQHTTNKNMYLFNGLGTRGFSAGPSLARQMLDLLVHSIY